MDYELLRLAAKGDVARLDEILQMQCRDTFAGKFPETLKTEGFRFPSLLVAQQATSDALAAYHARLAEPGMKVLDMTLGLGIDSFAFARRGARVTAFDLDENKVAAARDNSALMGLAVDARHGDSVEWLQQTSETYDIIFVDPARRSIQGRKLYALSDCMPDVTGENLKLIRAHCCTLIVKASPMCDVSKLRLDLQDESADVHITAVKGECKELLAVSPGKGLLTVYEASDQSEYMFTQEDMKLPEAYLAAEDDIAQMTLAEPAAPIMKAQVFGWLCQRYDALMADRNTHIAFLRSVKRPMPADLFAVRAVYTFSKEGIRQLKQRVGDRAEVAVRNFPLKADELRKRLGIKDGGAVADKPIRVYGITIGGKKLLLVTEPEAKP